MRPSPNFNVGSDFKVAHLISSIGKGEFADTAAHALRSGVQGEAAPWLFWFSQQARDFQSYSFE
jgi:hypothetical protein